MTVFHLVLEARDPTRNVWRRYEITVERDLFGIWVVEVTFGRISSRGRTLRYAQSDGRAARALVRDCLHRRRSAPRRIGVSYSVIRCHDPDAWTADLSLG